MRLISGQRIILSLQICSLNKMYYLLLQKIFLCLLLASGLLVGGTGAEGARQRLENIQPADVSMIKKQGTTLEMITAWQDFYEQEQQRNENNPTAKYRARLMKKIADLW